MLEKIKQNLRDDPSWTLFLAFAFFSLLSLPIARLFLALTLISLIWRRNKLSVPPQGYLALAYILFALFITAFATIANSEFGVAHGLWSKIDEYLVPHKGLGKITKLLWYIACPITFTLVNTKERLTSVMRAMIYGAIILSLQVIIIHPILAYLQTNIHSSIPCIESALTNYVDWPNYPFRGRPPSFGDALAMLGRMHIAQRLMLALLASVALLVRTPKKLYIIASILITIASIMTCKRAALIIGIALSCLLLLMRFRLRHILLTLIVAALCAYSQPKLRARLADLPKELEMYQNEGRHKTGGRLFMWKIIVPALHKEHPYGIGFRALTEKKMRSIDWHVERNRTHVHSTPLQVLVDCGYAGLAIWLAWMLCALFFAYKTIPISPFPFAGIASLVIYGLIEYNLADSAVVLPFATLLGLTLQKKCLPEQTSQQTHK